MTKTISQHSRLNREDQEQKKARPWLEKHYEEKRQRSVRLVKASVDQLVQRGQPVTLEAICRMSVEMDVEGRGVKKSSILDNPDAHAYYQEHSSTYQTAKRRERQGTRSRKMAALPVQPLRIDPHRDVDRVRRRYLHMTKTDLVERLLMVEQAYAENQSQCAHLQFELAELLRVNEEQKSARNR